MGPRHMPRKSAEMGDRCLHASWRRRSDRRHCSSPVEAVGCQVVSTRRGGATKGEGEARKETTAQTGGLRTDVDRRGRGRAPTRRSRHEVARAATPSESTAVAPAPARTPNGWHIETGSANDRLSRCRRPQFLPLGNMRRRCITRGRRGTRDRCSTRRRSSTGVEAARGVDATRGVEAARGVDAARGVM